MLRPPNAHLKQVTALLVKYAYSFEDAMANCTPSALLLNRLSARVTSLLLGNQLALGTRTRALVKKDFTMALPCLKCGHSLGGLTLRRFSYLRLAI